MSMNNLLFQLVAIVVLVMSISRPGLAQDHHAFVHEETAQIEESPKLNHGKLWETDVPLREGMVRIRMATVTAQTSSTDGKLDRARAMELAASIDGSLAYMFEHCSLEPAADENLHVLLERLIHAVSELKKDPNAAGGLPQILDVLASYPKYFNHAGWEPLPPKTRAQIQQSQ